MTKVPMTFVWSIALPVHQVVESTFTARMVLMEKAGWLLIVCVGGGRLAGGHKVLSETGLICKTWNVGWILIELGSRSLSADGLMSLVIGKGPIKQGAIFLEGVF